MAILFKNGRVIIGNGEVIERGTVVVDGQLVKSVGPSKKYPPSKKDTVFDVSGKTVLPGLIDAHIHICVDGSPDPITSLLKDSVPQLTLKAADHARRTLEAGVTTVRDMGGKDYIDLAIRDGIESGILQGPRMLCSGKLVCMTGGHGWQFGREANGMDEVRAAVREQLKAGADLIKLMATGGIMTKGVEPGSTQFTLEELIAGVEEARKAGRRTATHAQGTEGIKNALWAGINSIEHGFFLDDEAIGLLLDMKAFVVPTLCAPYHIIKAGVRRGVPAYAVEKSRKVMKSHWESVKKARKAGVPIAMGTDAGTPFNRHGENLKEMELLVRVGFTPMEAIVATTKTASEVLGLGDKIGMLEKGKLADLIVIDGNPLENIGVLQHKEKIMAIMKEGRFYKREL
ncbi:MAG: amidohydrolase family protein [Deltaproteobacteria bacterium]|nr:amidohydrolase family protein [Deltaproteobacteria bacterium]